MDIYIATLIRFDPWAETYALLWYFPLQNTKKALQTEKTACLLTEKTKKAKQKCIKKLNVDF